MTTVKAAILDRLFRDYLYAADRQPSTGLLAAAMTVDAASLTYDAASFLLPEEEQRIASAVIVEVDREQMRVTGAPADGVTPVLRAYNGTEAAVHDDDAVLTVSPHFGRQAAWDAVCDTIEALFPYLHRPLAVEVVAAAGVVELDAAVVDIDDAIYLSGGEPVEVETRLWRRYAPSSTKVGVEVDAPAGVTVYLNCQASFTRPVTEDDELDDIGLEAAHARIVIAGAAAQLISSKDLALVNMEFITQQLQSEGFPVLTPSRIRDSLQRYHDVLLQRAAKAQQARRSASRVDWNRTVVAGF